MTKEEAAYLSDILKAYSEGKQIEVKGYNVKWIDIDIREDPWLTKNPMNYRIKPKPEPKLRPYKNAEEFLKAQKEHGPMVKSKMGNYLSITEVSHKGAWFSDMDISHYENMVNNYCWQDGSPCGILEE